MYFLRKLRTYHVDKTIMRLFYKSVVESVILCNCLVWFGGCRQKDLKPLERIARRGGKIIGEVRDLTHICNDKILQKANEILGNENHLTV